MSATRFAQLLLALVPLAACGAVSEVLPEQGVRPGVLRLQPCELRASAGRVDGECGELWVAESPGDADSPLIRLPLKRFPAMVPGDSAPIFWLAGGPGQSNLDYRPPSDLLARHDVVLVGYRGVDDGPRLACPEVRRAMRGDGRDLLGEASLAAVRAAFDACAHRLGEIGVDFAAYTMAAVVGDLEAAREALGYPKVHLLGASYGTRVAQVYAQRHPGSLERIVMVAPNPPGRFVWEPGMVDRQLALYAELCRTNAACSARTRDLAASMRGVAQEMPRRWLLFPIDGGKVRVTSFALLFHRDTAAMVFDAWLAAAQGDASGLALLSLAYDFVLPSMFVWGDMAAKAGSADCQPQRDHAPEMEPPSSVIGSPLSTLLWAGIDCTRFAPESDAVRHAQPSEVPTLLLTGSLDFSTPAEYARAELLPVLRRGVEVQVREAGHVQDLLGGQRAAARRLLAHWFEHGEVDASGFVEWPMEFRVDWGLPRIAKLAVAALTGLLVLMAWLVWRRLRRWRRGRCLQRSMLM